MPDLSPTPERLRSPWKTSTDWVALDTAPAGCEHHGPFTAVLWQSVVPAGWEARMAKKRNSLKLSGVTNLIPDFWGRCPRCDDMIHEEQMAAYEEAINGAEMRKALRIQQAQIAGIDPRYAEAEPFGMKCFHPPMKKALAAIRDYCIDLGLVIQQGRCMTFLGSPGVGKTHAMCAILNYAISKGRSAKYVTAEDIATEVKNTYSKGSEYTEGQIIESMVDVDFLAVDEVARMASTDHTKKLFQAVIDKRYRKCRPTLIGSNLRKTEFEALVGQATAERLREGGGKVVTMAWESLREREDLK